jgi:hypothetical protein
LIDEYDKPLCDRITSLERYREIENTLKKLYDVVGQCNNCWRLVFITGLTKCSKHLLFAQITDLQDLSESLEGAYLFGFSQTELQTCLSAHLAAYAQQLQHPSLQQTIDFITSWCGSYHFSCSQQDLQAQGLINPRSVLYHLEDKRQGNYFFEGCTPSFLIELLKLRKYAFALPEVVRVKKNEFEYYDQETMLPEVALYASGYLTLCGFDKTTGEYLLKIPNMEVEQTFQILKKNVCGYFEFVMA